MTARDQHAILARWSHGIDMLGGIGIGQNANGSSTGSIKNAVSTTGSASAGAAGRKGFENFSCLVIQLHAVFRLLRASGPDTVVTQHQLQVASRMSPCQFSILG